jgi:hypothetical protein
VFWCYGYKRQVSTDVNIKTNKKDNEFHIQNSMHGWHLAQYIISYKFDVDGLFPAQRAVHAFHQ